MPLNFRQRGKKKRKTTMCPKETLIVSFTPARDAGIRQESVCDTGAVIESRDEGVKTHTVLLRS